MLPSLARALFAPYKAMPVTFDGTNDYLTLGADFSPPATDGKNCIVSFWFRRNGGGGTALRVISSNVERFVARFTTGNLILFTAVTAGGTTVGTVTSSTTYNDTIWHHCLIQMDAANSICRMYVDDVDVSSSVTTSNNNADFTLTDWAVGATTAGATKFIGDLADVYLNLAETLDISVEANRRRFRSATGKPVFLGPHGERPTGNVPIVYLSGYSSGSWHMNRGFTAGFTLNGALDRGALSPSA